MLVWGFRVCLVGVGEWRKLKLHGQMSFCNMRQHMTIPTIPSTMTYSGPKVDMVGQQKHVHVCAACAFMHLFDPVCLPGANPQSDLKDPARFCKALEPIFLQDPQQHPSDVFSVYPSKRKFSFLGVTSALIDRH